MLIGSDNTARKQVEAERALLYEALQDKNAELENAKSVAEKANLAKSDFLSSMSHELRTPLNAILGFTQLLEAGSPAPTPAQIVRLHQILKAGWYLLELINEILDLAVIESGRLSLSREPVSLIDVMVECQAMTESQAKQRNIQINFLPFDNTWFANADRTRVKQVLINLLSNAIKYNRKHGIVEVKCTLSTPERIRISIKDSGAGLPPEKLAQLFQPFNRLGQEDGAEEGTGIGLVVTKQLVELMGGSMGVESTVGVGSEFWIELIRDVTPQLAAGHTMPAKLVQQAQENAALRTLLYVEDNPANLMLVEQIIEGHPQIRMLSAHNGNLGIALARAHLPDVILMDINLPGISGFQALKILREDPVNCAYPGAGHQCQCDAPRYRERTGSRILPVPDQTHQGQRIPGGAGLGTEIVENKIGPRIIWKNNYESHDLKTSEAGNERASCGAGRPIASARSPTLARELSPVTGQILWLLRASGDAAARVAVVG